MDLPTSLPWSKSGCVVCLRDVCTCVSVGYLGVCRLSIQIVSACKCSCVWLRHVCITWRLVIHASFYQGLVYSRTADEVDVGGQLRTFGLNSVSCSALSAKWGSVSTSASLQLWAVAARWGCACFFVHRLSPHPLAPPTRSTLRSLLDVSPQHLGSSTYHPNLTQAPLESWPERLVKLPSDSEV